ncbi:cytochrome d ubiquinol oxidase subunit II [Tenuifilum thalassicum]|uniref:Cytochrome d ubiquinol oxidase subunit II n=1 Tax=Tenuifilum thalassicum TaxID=2590900 RepID=A0A7D4CI00_9BACT|nr:cytochrome d ubiquinol oxidase subunit II [Tenuifilum thalassicum]QKG80966.1 cytochrome d ubiquinol oxidase subunit II [Tenuifilum thalassicum]
MVDTTYILLQHYWWFIISLLGALLVFLLFVQGGQTLIYTLGKTEMERTMLINALGRKWEFTFTTLVTFGGAFFASFPLFYSTSFGGAYWVWMAILFCFVIQAVSYEYRSKPNNFLGPKTFEIFLFINGLLGTVLLGTAVATFFTGSEFSVAKINLTNLSNPVISSWETPWHGLEAALNLHNLSLGLAVFFLARVLAILYFMNSIDHDEIFARAKKQLIYNAIPFLVFFLTFVIWLLIRDGFALNPETNEIFMQEHKYLLNLIQMPIVLVLFLAGVVLVIWGIAKSILKTYTKGIWFAGIGTVLTVLSLFLIAGYNNTAYYPSTFNLQHSLTIFNSSSSKFTLTVMSVVSILVPFVVAYIWYAWKSINNKKIDEEEMKNETHVY